MNHLTNTLNGIHDWPGAFAFCGLIAALCFILWVIATKIW